MSYNGSGTFLINTAGQPVVSGTVISSTAFNALTADLATGLSTAITKDGQTTVTANIPMSNYKFTGLGAGSAATDSANLSQVQSSVVKLLASVSGADTITAVGSPTVTAYAAGQMFYFIAAGDNTTTVTLNIDGLGAKAVTRDGSVALAAGDIKSGEVVVVVYDGTRFQVVSQINSSGNATFANVSITSALNVGGVATFTSNPVLSGGTANGVLYLNASKVATSGSALSFASSVLTVNNTLTTTNGTNLINVDSPNQQVASFISGVGYGTLNLNASPLVFQIAGTEGMRLTSTGLGIGTSSPADKLQVGAFSGNNAITVGAGTTGVSSVYFGDGTGADRYRGYIDYEHTNDRFVLGTAATSKATLDSSGNLGLGVTPASWGGGFKALQIVGGSIAYTGSGANEFAFTSNAIYDATDGRWEYRSTGDKATRYSQDAQGVHYWYVNNTAGTAGNPITWNQAMTLDASGNLGLGDTNPSAYGKMVVVNNSSGAETQGLYLVNGNTAASTAVSLSLMPSNSTARVGRITAVQDGAQNISLTFSTSAAASPVERARITSGGALLVGTTTAGAGLGYDTQIAVDAGAGEPSVFKTSAGVSGYCSRMWNTATSGNNLFVNFQTEAGGTDRGSISYNRTAGQVAYNVTSDARLKDNIADAADAGSKVDALQVRQFDWKETGNHVEYGFVAQELDAVAPHAVSKPDNEEAMWSVDYSKLVPMLVKEIQSLRARVAQLESK